MNARRGGSWWSLQYRFRRITLAAERGTLNKHDVSFQRDTDSAARQHTETPILPFEIDTSMKAGRQSLDGRGWPR
jgi:hypothetical protein